MWFDIMYESRARYEELRQQAEQERRVRHYLTHQPSLFQRTWGRVLVHLGSQMVQWGAALQSRPRTRSFVKRAQSAMADLSTKKI